MGRGLSELQRDVLAALDAFPLVECNADGDPSSTWDIIARMARPADILAAIGCAHPTGAQRVTLSKSLLRLQRRRVVAAFRAKDAPIWRYARIAAPALRPVTARSMEQSANPYAPNG
jgi:hypothetical protein